MNALGKCKTALVTGCSTGFGRATALHLANRGWHVIATVRHEEDSQGLLSAFSEPSSAISKTNDNGHAGKGSPKGQLEPMLCDITSSEQVAALAERLGQLPDGLDALVNSAGTALIAPVELVPIAELRAQFDVNVLGQVAVTQAATPGLRKAKGRILNISSISGRVSVPMFGPYSASKFALEALSDALRVELAPRGVRVILIEPGPSATAIWDTSKERTDVMLRERDGDLADYAKLVESVQKMAYQSLAMGFPPESFARLIEKILLARHPRTRYVIPWHFRGAILARKWLPDSIWDRALRWQLGW